MTDQLSLLLDLDRASDTNRPNLCTSWKNARANDCDVVNIVKNKEGYEIELWRNFELVNSEQIFYCPMCGRKLT